MIVVIQCAARKRADAGTVRAASADFVDRCEEFSKRVDHAPARRSAALPQWHRRERVGR